MYYCTDHHTIETRNTSKQNKHENCTFLTKADMTGNFENLYNNIPRKNAGRHS